MATIKNATLESVTVNLKTSEVKISLSVGLSDYGADRAIDELEPYLGEDHNSIDVVITPKQLPLKDVLKTVSAAARARATVQAESPA